MRNIFRSGSYATVASTAALVVALGGTSYAAAQITSQDIKDGTIQTQDISQPAQVQARVVHNDNGTAMTGSAKTVLSLNVKPGNFVVDAKAQAYGGSGAYAECWLTGPSGSTIDYSYWYLGGNSGYGVVDNQAAFSTTSPVNVQLNCVGSNSTLYNKKLQVIRVAKVTDTLGANVAQVPVPHFAR